MSLIWRGIACGLGALALARATEAQERPEAILRRAILAAGGESSLGAAEGLEWEAAALVHIPGRDIAIRGVWKIQPPDSAVVATYDTTRGPTTTWRLIVAGRRGWLERDSVLTPLSPATLSEERHQFYLYSLLRLVRLRQPGVRLIPVPANSAGNVGLRVEQAGRLSVRLYVDSAGRVERIMTTFATGGGEPGDRQDIRLTGTLAAGGVNWFRKMVVHRAGKPYFEMELTALRAHYQLSDPLLAGPRPRNRSGSARRGPTR
ncbi:MAG: hypothetical protein ABI647_14540 [Gemmatimonadota bacterium]